MPEHTTPNDAALPRTISGSATLNIMAQQLTPWALYDLSGARDPDSLETMQDYFRRFRKLRGNILDGIGYKALQRSWCAFIRRWNRLLEDGSSFQLWLVNREKLRAYHFIGALRERLCDNAWNEDRLCFVHVNEECQSCDSNPRPAHDEWRRHIAECPLSEREQSWIEKYKRSLSKQRTLIIRGTPCWQHHSRQRSQSPRNNRRREANVRLPVLLRGSRLAVVVIYIHFHHESIRARARIGIARLHGLVWLNNIWNAAKKRSPTYPARVKTQSGVYNNCVRMAPRAFHEPTVSLLEEGPHEPQYDPQSSVPVLLHPQAVVGPRVGNAGVLVDQDDVDQAVNKAANAQLEAEAALERAAQAERTASKYPAVEPRNARTDEVSRMPGPWTCTDGIATAPDVIDASSTARRPIDLRTLEAGIGAKP